MTTYHRGRVRSLYRKHAFGTALTISLNSNVARSQLRAPPPDGTTMIKSVRGLLLFPALTSGRAVGWVGYARSSAGDTAPDFEIDQSDVFGVQAFAIGSANDQLMALPLKGITLAVNEAWWMVGQVTNLSGVSGSVTAAVSMLYAIRTTDST